MSANTTEPQVIAGERPEGRTPANGTHRWATRSFAEGVYTFTEYDGWLIDETTTTTDPDLAAAIKIHIRRKLG